MDLARALAQLESAQAEDKISSSAAGHVRQWLTEPRYAAYAPAVAEHIEQGKWKELDDVFWTVIPFGTGGRRGRMYPIGCNAINERTIGESAQGLAEYVKVFVESRKSKVEGRSAQSREPSRESLSCAIAYDTRHRSREFAELCASIMVANGFTVYFLDDYRSTPELSFLVREKQCSCGIMVTASHNPPSDNAVKVYWSTGGQIVPPHDRGIVERVMQVTEVRRADFAEALSAGQVVLCTEETDERFIEKVLGQRCAGPRDLKVVYSPLHGVGASAVVPVLYRDGFRDIEVYAPHAQPDGDFPNVPGNVSNPENAAIFDMIIGRAVPAGADLVLATDPDCDRMGCAAPVSNFRKGAWAALAGNQLSALLTDFVLDERKKTGQLTPEHFVVTTLVTTPMVRRIATSYGIRTLDNVHVGFKWIGQQIDAAGADKFVFGTEESHGFLVGQYVRDKDGAAACMLMAELAAAAKAAKKTVFDRLVSLYWQHGYHGERQINIFMTGSAGMQRMQTLMQRLRAAPPAALAGIDVRQIRDYAELTTRGLPASTKEAEPLDAPRGDMVILDLAEEGHFVAIRPSGTEPKVKFYLFTYMSPERQSDVDASREQMTERLNCLEEDLRQYVASSC
jgi:phosphoglucomutase/phosphomannomutase